jgi:hypothetical protein
LISALSFFENDNKAQENFNLFGDETAIGEDELEAILQDSIINNIQGIPKGLNTTLSSSMQKVKEEALKSNREIRYKDSLKRASGVSYNYLAEKHVDTLEYIEKAIKKIELFYTFNKATSITNTAQALDSLKYKSSKTNIWLYNKTEALDRIEKNPVRFLQYLLSKTPFFLFFFAPLFSLFFWMIYSKKKANYMEHLVFIFHVFSWIFVVLLLCFIPDKLLPTSGLLAGIILFLIGPFYFYKALRNFYAQSRTITIIKFVFLNIVFLFGTSFFALIFFTLTATFY